MILFIILSVLLLLALFFLVVDLRRLSKKIAQLSLQVHALNESQTQFEPTRSELNGHPKLYLNSKADILELLTSTQQDAYNEYLSRGGKDDLQMWLMKSELDKMFP